MTEGEYRTAIRDVVELVRCAVNGTVPEAERVAAMDLPALFAAAEKHMLTAAAGMALRSAGIRDEAFVQAVAKAQRKNALLDADRAALLERLEQAGIWYMPLKGAVLQDLYPAYGMRQMSDNDILVDPERTKDVRAIMKDLGFQTERFGRSKHDIYFKLPVSSFEIHKTLFEPWQGKTVCRYDREVRGRLIGDEGNLCGRHFSPEDFYIYIVLHGYVHNRYGGIGLRFFLDVYMYLKAYGQTMDFARIEGETEDLGIGDFERGSRSLATHLFGGEPLTGEEEKMLLYVIESGTYGTAGHRVDQGVRELGGGAKGKLRYLRSRLFPPMEQIKTWYPLMYKSKVLLPLVPVRRLGRAVFLRWPATRGELRALLKKAPPARQGEGEGQADRQAREINP